MAARGVMADRRGAIAILVAVTFPALLGVCGLAVDFGIITREQTRLQIAADAAAMGAGRLLAAKTATSADFAAAGLLEAQAVTGGRWIGSLVTPITTSVASDWSSVTVTLTSTPDTYLMKSVSFTAPRLTASATASVSVLAGAAPTPGGLPVTVSPNTGVTLTN